MWKQSTEAPSPRENLGAMTLDRVTSLLVFARVVELRSFSAAGRALSTTTSAVSKRITRLEETLGVRLFHRTTRRLGLTDAGRTLYDHACRIVAEVETAEAAVLRLGTAARGLLRVSVPVQLGEQHLAPLFPRFLARHPEVRLDVSLSDRYVDLVEEGFDLAVRVGRLVDSSLLARKLCDVPLAVCAAPAYLRRHGTPRSKDELLRHECISYSNSPAEWRFVGADAPLAVRGSLRLNNGGAVREAAIAGGGVAVLPLFICGEALRAGTLKQILASEPMQELGLYAVSPPGRAPLPAVRAFIDFLVAELPPRLLP